MRYAMLALFMCCSASVLSAEQRMLVMTLEVDSAEVRLLTARVVRVPFVRPMDRAVAERSWGFVMEDRVGQALARGSVPDPTFVRGPAPGAGRPNSDHALREVVRGVMVVRVPWQPAMRRIRFESAGHEPRKPRRHTLDLPADLAPPRP
jgi:hypothetical protein